MYNSFLIKYGEIGIKGDNRHLFEDALAKRIRTLLARIDGDFDVTKTRGRIYVNCGGNWNFDETIDVLQHVFGIVGICPVVIYEKGDIEKLRADIVSYISEEHPGCTSTFKVKARRVDKEYPLTSMEVDAELGEAILMAYPSMKVDVHDPEILFDVSPGCFVPQPKVTSSVIRLTRRPYHPVQVHDEQRMFSLVRAAFNQRRKTLVNALSSGLPWLSREEAEAAVLSCGFDPRIRGEALSITDFARLSDAVSS